MLYLLYILLSSILCMWVTCEKQAVYLIFYLLFFYCIVEKIIFRKEVIFTTEMSILFVGEIIVLLLLKLKNPPK